MGLLAYDPKKRLTAAEALNHPYFQESPRAQDPGLMPMYPTTHDGSKKKRKGSLDEDQVKNKILHDEKINDARFGGKDRSYGGFRLRV